VTLREAPTWKLSRKEVPSVIRVSGATSLSKLKEAFRKGDSVIYKGCEYA